jgi:hypothetical protein
VDYPLFPAEKSRRKYNALTPLERRLSGHRVYRASGGDPIAAKGGSMETRRFHSTRLFREKGMETFDSINNARKWQKENWNGIKMRALLIARALRINLR